VFCIVLSGGRFLKCFPGSLRHGFCTHSQRRPPQMDKCTFRNINFATVGGLRDVLDNGSVLRIRNEEVAEIQNRLTIISRPWERCLFLRHRGNNIFATVGETLWVRPGEMMLRGFSITFRALVIFRRWYNLAWRLWAAPS
jgi:hypothetical protein